MPARLAVVLLALVLAACGGKVEGPGGGGSGSGSGGSSPGNGGSGGSGGSGGGNIPPGQTGTGGGTAPSGSSSPGNPGGPGGPGPTCTMSGGDGSESIDGGCDSVAEYGSCGTTQYAVSCDCAASRCDCVRNGQTVRSVTYECAACDPPDEAWTACGFP